MSAVSAAAVTGAVAVYQHPDWRGFKTRLYAAREADVTKRGKVTRPARDAQAEVLGALGGPMWTSDPERLRIEAGLLLSAADELERMTTDTTIAPSYQKRAI